jgi:YD repeat-containing protein
LTLNQDAQALSVFLGNGRGTFRNEASYSSDLIDPESDSQQLGDFDLGDINEDGFLDVVGAGYGSTTGVSVRLGQRDGTLGEESLYETQGSYNRVLLGDFNLDGNLDIVAAGSGLSVLIGNHSGGFEVKNNPVPVNLTGALAIGDFDQDGDIDLATGSFNTWVSPNGVSLVQTRRTYTYDPIFNQLTSETDELGRKTLYQIDPLTGQRMGMTRVVGAIGRLDDVTTTYTYMAQGQIDTETDPLGRITDYDYTPKGLLKQVTYAKGTIDQAVKRFEYDDAGNQSAVIDENGHRTGYLYNAMNRLIEMTEADPDGAGALTSPVMTYTYDARGNQKTVTDARGNTTVNEYDAMDHLIKVTQPDPDGSGVQTSPVMTYQYDRSGNRISMTDPLERITEYKYDACNRLTETILPDGSITKQISDSENHPVTRIDANGNPTSMVYDERGRLTKQIDAQGHVSRSIYDVANQLVAQLDANGNRTTYQYDDLGRQIVTTDPRGKEATTVYDKVGNVIGE